MSEKKSEEDEINFDDLEEDSLPLTPSASASASAGSFAPDSTVDEGEEEGEEEGESDDSHDPSETGVREHPVDKVLEETADHGADFPPLTEAEIFAHDVKRQHDATIQRAEVLLKDIELPMEERIRKIRETMKDLDGALMVDVIMSDTERSVAAKAMIAALASRLDHSLLRQMAGVSPSSLPAKLQTLSTEDADILSNQLAAFTAMTDEGKKEAQRLRVIVATERTRLEAAAEEAALEERDAAAKLEYAKAFAEAEAKAATKAAAKVDERGPTLAVNTTPVPSASQPIEAAWQSGPDAPARPDQDKVETVAHVEVKVEEEPSVILSPSLIAPPPAAAAAPAPQPGPNNSMPGQVRTQIRVGRAPDNDWVIAHPNVSSHHALLSLNEGSIKVEDLGSSQGTYFADEHGAWTRIEHGKPVTVRIGQRLRFAAVEITSSHDAQRQTHLHFIESDGKRSASQMFFMEGEQLAELHRLEQARIDAEEAARPKPPTTAEREARQPLRSPTAIQQSLARGNTSGSGLGRALGIGALVIGAMAVLLFGLHWAANHLDFGRGDVVADTETETSTESETTHIPTEVTEPETTETETSTPIREATFSCRPGSEVASCNRVEDFLLARADGASYWDCSGITPEQYSRLYTVEDPSGSRNIVVNTCGCNYCEPTATR